MTPFVIYALPRSRTFWLSQFLTIGGYHCHHEQARHLHDVDDMRTWLAQDWTGTAETVGAHGWRIAESLRPDLRVLVVRRPVEHVLASLLRAGVPPNDELRRRVRILDRRLGQIEREGRNVLSVEFVDLERRDTCAAVFEHCIGAPMPTAWWKTMAPLNLQCDLGALQRHAAAHHRRLRRLSAAVVHEHASLLRLRRYEHEAAHLPPVAIAEERFPAFWRDSQAVIAEHAAEAGPRDDVPRGYNVGLMERLDAMGAAHIVMARHEGAVVGYWTAIIGPSLESSNHSVATQTPFFVTRRFRALGPRLAREAINRLWDKGVGEVLMRAGTLASGPQLGALYRRMGATDFGRLYRLGREAT